MHPVSTCQLVNVSTNEVSLWPTGQLVNESTNAALFWSTEPLGLRASSHALSAPRKLPDPRLKTKNPEQRISGVDFAALIGFE